MPKPYDYKVVEFVEYDPENPDTYPSVCAHREEVEARFGFTGGETLVFSVNGHYIGKVSHMLKGGEK